MKKNMTSLLPIIIIVVVILYFVIYNSYKTSTESTNLPNTNSTDTTPAKELNMITIRNMAFHPLLLTVKAGTTVTWTNEDSAPHAIKSDTFNSENLNKNDTFKYTFSEKGSFDYICSIHPYMKGTIVVE